MADTTSFAANDWSVNSVLRWEIVPGSTLYAVYTHQAFDDEVFQRDATLSRTLPALLLAPSDDVLQVKLAWLFR